MLEYIIKLYITIQEIEKFEQELEVEYITSAERIGMQRGVEKGERMVLESLLQYKFKTIPETYRLKIERADAQALLKWAPRVLDSQTLDEVFKS